MSRTGILEILKGLVDDIEDGILEPKQFNIIETDASVLVNFSGAKVPASAEMKSISPKAPA